MISNDPRGVSFLEKLRTQPCCGGLDLAATRDLTAFVLAFDLNPIVAVYPWFFLPSEGLEERCQHDGVRYDVWAKQGFLELTPGPVTEWQYVVGRIKQLATEFSIRHIAYDRYGARDTVASLQGDGILTMPFSQTYGGMGAPMRRIEELIVNKKLVHTGQPVLRWNMDCVRVQYDYANNMRPVKTDRLSDSKRIDGVVAMIMAVAGVIELWAEGTPGNIEFW